MRRALLLSLFLFMGLAFTKWSLDDPYSVVNHPGNGFIESEYLKELLLLRTVENATPDIWPVIGFVASDFGWRRLRGRKEFHTGIDIAAPYGSRVVATAPGYVLFSGWVRGYGNTVVLYHGHGFVTLYAHMAMQAVKRGEFVDRNRVVGYVGSTGRTTGSHLHYEVIKYGIRQNPILFLP